MILPAKLRSRWDVPIRSRVKQGVLFAVLAVFATAHLLTATPQPDSAAKSSVTIATSSAEAGEEIHANIESNESSVSVDMALRDAYLSIDQNDYLGGQGAKQTYALKRYWRPGTNGPPSHNNTSVNSLI